MLFKTTAKLIEYAQLGTETNFINVVATLRMVEEQHVIPVLGKDMYNYLDDLYTGVSDETSLAITYKNLLHQCRMIIGPMLCYYYAPKAELNFTDGGLRRTETGNSKTAYQYQVKKFREQNLEEGTQAIELLLQFLDDNKNTYILWRDSSAFANYRKLFIKSGKEFFDLFPSHSPYRNYWAMRSSMLDVEEINIRKTIGDVLFDALKTKDQSATGTFTAKELLLLKRLKKAIAYFTVSKALPFLNVQIAANGITVATTNRSENDEVSSRNFASDNSLSSIANQCLINGDSWIKSAVDYLNDPDNKTDFSGWPVVVPSCIARENERCRVTANDCNRNNGGSFGLF